MSLAEKDQLFQASGVDSTELPKQISEQAFSLHFLVKRIQTSE